LQKYSRTFANQKDVRPVLNPLPVDARPEIFIQDINTIEEFRWVPQGEGVAFLPLCFGATQGYFVNLLRVRRSGVLSRHQHTGAVHAQVLKGRWFYLEHEWMATEGSFITEPPGEIHTLIVPDDVPEMITWFHATAGYIYLDGDTITGHEDVFTKLASARAHYEAKGLDQTYLDQLVR
jgi:quercetin dioxygenase-like cupin family protein